MDAEQARFVRALAEFLVGDQARQSIELQMGKASAKKWATLRTATPLFGYPTVEEAERTLATFLWPTRRPAGRRRRDGE